MKTKTQYFCKLMLGMLLFIYYGMAFAGQTVEEFFLDAQRRSVNMPEINMRWYSSPDLSASSIISQQQLIAVTQTQESIFYLAPFVDNPDPAKKFSLALSITDNILPDFNVKNDVTLQPTTCNFTFEKGSKCAVTMTASEMAPITESKIETMDQGKVRRAYFERTSGTSYLISGFRKLRIYENTDGGIINGEGPDRKTGNLSGTAVSHDPASDNVPLTLKVNAATNVQGVHLVYSVMDNSVASMVQKSCDITTIESGYGSCAAGNVTPNQLGQTQIVFDRDQSYWVSLHGDHHSYSIESHMEPVAVHIGTMYAGYIDDVVFRKGAAAFKVIGGRKLKGVNQLGLDGVYHRLYIVDGSAVYKLESTNQPSPVVNKIFELEETYSGKTLSLANTPGLMTVGATSTGKDYDTVQSVCDPAVIPPESKICNEIHNLDHQASIQFSTMDLSNNISYVTDSHNNFTAFYTNPEGGGGGFVQYPQQFESGDNANNTVAAASNEMLYASANYGEAQWEGGSHLYRWIESNLVKQDVDNSPFVDGVHINLLQFMNEALYAGSDDGRLFRLDYSSDKGSWKLVASLGDSGNPVTDSAIDNNGNIYVVLSSDGGVWKVPYDGKPAYPLTDYYPRVKNDDEPEATSVVIENN